MNVGDIVSFEDVHTIPDGAQVQVMPTGVRIAVMPETDLEKLIKEIRIERPGDGSDSYLAAWILARFDRKGQPAPNVHVDSDGDMWHRQNDGTYSLNNHSEGPLSHVSYTVVVNEYGTFGERDN